MTRSLNMARIRSADTRPELRLRRALHADGLRYRVRLPVPGHPDIAFPRQRVAVFVDGCFWHGCPIHYSAPATNGEFWARKLAANVQRDRDADRALRALGWTPVHIWQHDLKGMDEAMARIRQALAADTTGGEIVYGADEGAPYGAPPPWWRCPCGSPDVQVVAVDAPGSLKPHAERRPAAAAVQCRVCGRLRTAVTAAMDGEAGGRHD